MNQDDAKVWHNGNMIPAQKATVPLLSHGFSRGSAIFEVFGIHKGPDGPIAFRMDEHLKRLENSVALLEMKLAHSTDEIIAAVKETVAASQIGRGLIKILAYWGEEAIIQLVLDSKLDLTIFAIPESNELKLDQMYNPVSACLSKWRKIDPQTIPVAAKACSNYLNGYMARRDAINRGFDVGLMIGTDGYMAEGGTESVFIVKDGVLKTPPLGRILSGISRKSILEAAPVLGIPVSEEEIHPEEMMQADEIFTAHSGTKVLPISRFEDTVLETPGPITAKLIDCFEQVLQFKDDRFSHWFQTL